MVCDNPYINFKARSYIICHSLARVIVMCYVNYLVIIQFMVLNFK